MMWLHVQTLSIAVLASVACVLPGIFLVLRGVSLMSDAISHAVLLGIAVMFLWIQNLDSPLLLVGASFAGLVTVFLTETVIKTRRLKEDAAIGIVFPLFFSCGVILISLFARDVHLDIDMVILGEVVFAPFNRLVLFGYDWGPAAFYTLGATVLLNVGFIYFFYKELVLSIFDHDFAYVIGYSPSLVYYMLMGLTSITAVSAFDIVGSIVVVALMITPPATAYLVAYRVESMIWLSIIISIAASLGGYACAVYYDVSTAGSIATVSGLLFMIVFIGAPHKGLIAQLYYKRQQKIKIFKRIEKDNE